MTRETKVGLLVGTGIILLIGIIVSDHLSVVQSQESARLTSFASDAQRHISQSPAQTDPIDSGQASRVRPLPIAADEPAAQPSAQQQRPLPLPASQFPQDQFPQDQYPQHQPRQPRSYDAQPPALIIAQQTSDEQASMTGRPSQTQGQLIPEARSASAFAFDPPAVTPTGALSPARRNDDALEPVIYQVKRGDSLYQIAAQFYGSGDYWKHIARANRNVIGPNDSVREGVRLVIPHRSTVLAALANDALASGDADNAQPLDRVGRRQSAAGLITVEAGDTLSSLAQQHLGSDLAWTALFEANRDKLRDADDIKVGMTLRLPAGRQTSARPTDSRNTRSTAGARTYTVQRGDTLIKIAEDVYGRPARWRDIFNANRDKLRNANDINVGDQLTLP